MNKYKYIIVSIIALILSGCTQDIEVTRSYPTVQTLKVTNITNNGVIFNAELNNVNNYEIIEYGFIWGDLFKNLKYDIDETIKLSNKLDDGKFSFNLTYGMLNNEKYKVKAYLKTKDKIIYAPEFAFTSQGGIKTILSTVSPNYGVVGDTIQLIGKNFSEVNHKNWVQFGEKRANIVKSTKTTITCIVPAGVWNGRYNDKVQLSVFRQKVELNFNIIGPKINSVEPLVGTFLDEITIKGENFSILPEMNQIYIGNIIAQIISSNKNKIVVKIPGNIQSKNNSVKVKIESKDHTSNQVFVMKTPKVLSITQGPIKVNQTITINGENLNPVLKNNSVNFYGGSGKSLIAEVISGDTKHLVVKVPEGPYLNREAVINVNLANIYHSNHFKRIISNKWIQIDNSITKFPIDRKTFANNIVMANNQPFFASKLHKIEPHIVRFINRDKYFSWARTPITNNNIVDNGIISTLSDGEYPYIYNHSAFNFWKFNEISNVWTEHENFPGVNRENVTQFTINGELYMGFGKNSGNYLDDMYKFSPNTGKWTQVASRPGSSKRNNTAVFVINNIAYMIGGATDSSSKDCWAYNSLTDSWSQIADYPYAIDGAAAFELDGEGYVTCGKIVGNKSINEVWKYNPTLDNWTQGESIGNKPRYNHLAYSLNNKAYIAGGITDDNEEPIYPADIYEYIK